MPNFAVNDAAIPVMPGMKSESERFAGADRTYSIEAMMGDGKALQSGTSHNLGQNFAKAFEIRYLDKNGVLQHCWTTSWGLSTRFIGAIIMVHGDDQGLILPPRLAPHQAVIVPIYKSDEEKAQVMQAARRIKAELVASNFRVILDEREGTSPGFKFNDWEMRGVPLRIEIGPKDVQKEYGGACPSRQAGKEGKSFVPQSGLLMRSRRRWTPIQKALLDRALDSREANTADPEGLWRIQGSCGEGLRLFVLVRQRAVREKHQGRNQGDAALHPARPAGKRDLHLLRPACEGKSLFRQSVLIISVTVTITSK